MRISLPVAFVLCAGSLFGCGPLPEVVRDLAYDPRADEPSRRMDVFLPEPERSNGGAVLIVHGGAWMQESKERFDEVASQLAEAGYVAASTNYRLVPHERFPIAVRDVHCALATLFARAPEYGVDPERIVLLGYSAGGHLVSLLGVAGDDPDFAPECGLPPSPPPRAVISGAGVQDLVSLSWAGPVQNFLGGTIEEFPARYEQASPLRRVRTGAPPFLFVHGALDFFVPHSQSVAMRDALRAVGTQAELLTVRGGNHVLNLGASGGLRHEEFVTDSPEGWWAILDFLERTVGER